MRTIKFRVWNKANGVMYDQLKDSPCFGQFEGDRAVSIEDVFFYEPQDFNVMQYTGLTDKNGFEIYEGDIVKWDEKEWGGPFSEIVNWDYELFDTRKNHWPRFCEVIGNIYENPELVKEDADE